MVTHDYFINIRRGPLSIFILIDQRQRKSWRSHLSWKCSLKRTTFLKLKIFLFGSNKVELAVFTLYI